MSINIGSLIGGLVIPGVVRYNPFVGYTITTTLFAMGVCVFILGSNRYVKIKPQGKSNITVMKIVGRAICGLQGLEKQNESAGGRYPDLLVRSVAQLASIIPISILTVPFNMVLVSELTMIQAQGIVMKRVGWIDAAWMANVDSVSVLIAGAIIGGWFLPFFERRTGKLMRLSTKFAVGSALGVLSMLFALLLDMHIKIKFIKSGQGVNILWQAPCLL